MSASAKVNRLREVGAWLKENAKRLLLFGFLTFAVLYFVALAKGVGYEARTDVTSVEIIVEGHPCYGFIVTGRLTCSFNPFLYPISHILGYEANSMFAGRSEPFENSGESVKGTAEFSAAFHEFLRNSPYHLAVSLVMAFGLSKLTCALEGKQQLQASNLDVD